MNKIELLEAAAKAVTDRGEHYGDVKTNFKQIADYWSLHLRNRHSMQVELTPDDVPAMMILMKLARLAHTPGHIDSLIDVAGYAACAGDLVEVDP